ncbi:hypothetical protein, partial [Mycobacterium hubeiense]|uniref:hypothetical protein n=1 Tax=Mycobacterium hubeiense TaxID=1867256 RepID=UPI001E5CC9D6
GGGCLNPGWQRGFDDRAGWPWTLWLRITEKGKEFGRSYEGEYRQWVQELSDQGREAEALPVRLEPGGLSREA